MKRVVSLFDIHHPVNIDLTGVLKFIEDFKPHIIVLGGDTFDLNYFSRWAEMSPNALSGDKFKADMEWGNDFLDKIESRMVKKRPRKIFIEGNHEERIRRFIDKYPYLNEMLALKRELHIEERKWEWIAENNYAKVGKLYYVHGHYTNKYHSEKHLRVYGKNIRYGHKHDTQMYMTVSPIDYHRRTARSIPCLCTTNPAFLRSRPNSWINGFQYAHIAEDGNFYESVPLIQGDKFIAEGRKYGSW
jgi:predicted MPP superfamily phosphohydrolase